MSLLLDLEPLKKFVLGGGWWWVVVGGGGGGGQGCKKFKLSKILKFLANDCLNPLFDR